MTVKQQQKPPVDFIRALSAGGLDDAHIINRETAERVLTTERKRLLEAIGNRNIDSVRDLSRQLDRNVSVVSRDLDVLFEADIIEFETEGRSKTPVLAHDHVVIEPLVLNGDVRARSE